MFESKKARFNSNTPERQQEKRDIFEAAVKGWGQTAWLDDEDERDLAWGDLIGDRKAKLKEVILVFLKVKEAE